MTVSRISALEIIALIVAAGDFREIQYMESGYVLNRLLKGKNDANLPSH